MSNATETYIKIVHCSLENSRILLDILTNNPSDNEVERRSLITKCQIVQDALVNIIGKD